MTPFATFMERLVNRADRYNDYLLSNHRVITNRDWPHGILIASVLRAGPSSPSSSSILFPSILPFSPLLLNLCLPHPHVYRFETREERSIDPHLIGSRDRLLDLWGIGCLDDESSGSEMERWREWISIEPR